MIEIAAHPTLSNEDKSKLICIAQERFKNRRKMAYIALITLVASLALLFLAAFIDGLSTCPANETCEGILKPIEDNQTLIIWIEGFLASIVAAYYGVSAWRPAS